MTKKEISPIDIITILKVFNTFESLKMGLERDEKKTKFNYYITFVFVFDFFV